MLSNDDHNESSIRNGSVARATIPYRLLFEALHSDTHEGLSAQRQARTSVSQSCELRSDGWIASSAEHGNPSSEL